MKLYNTLTRKVEPVKPLETGRIKLYTCGPTVYDNLQIGNWRNQVFYDTLVRVLGVAGYQVNHVMNITDVGHLVSDADEGEDKLEKGAKREGKSVWDVSKHYTERFSHGAKQLNIELPNKLIKATNAIDSQIKLIQVLFDKGFVYQTAQAIYFEVARFANYGKLSGQKLADKEIGVRDEVITDPHKKSPYDFAVWFFTVGHFSHHEMRWPTPWGEGFPGWHLECSAIIHQTLGEPIDIHTGGVDHIGTHHANEIAQSEAAFDKPLANIWMHNEFLQVDGKKMGKSLGNFYTLQDILSRGYDPAALRLLYLQSHYRSQQNFTFEALDAATHLLERLRMWSYGRFQDHVSLVSDAEFAIAKQTIVDVLSDDLKTPPAIVSLIQVVSLYEKQNRAITAPQMVWIDGLFGLGLSAASNISIDQTLLIKQRELARAAKDFEAADIARNRLKTQGIELKDTQFGPRWYKVFNKS